MSEIATQRCFNHQQREAVARCPDCKRFFCRECVTEHDDRFICASCLKAIAAVQPRGKPKLRALGLAGHLVLGFFILWMMFYWLGYMLLLLPTAFHQGTLWSDKAFKSYINERH